jgi:hypothetical protein
MRDYARVRSTFWTGPTGRRLAKAGRDAQVLALYLFSGPQSNMTCLYYLPMVTLCHEATFEPDDARRTLDLLATLRYAYYDPRAELVWVVEGAKYQISDVLHASDKRVKGILRELRPFLAHRFAHGFYQKYREPFSLPVITFPKGLRRGLQGASKALRSHEHEQEQEQEQEQNTTPLKPPQGGALPVAPENGGRRRQRRLTAQAQQREESLQGAILGGLKGDGTFKPRGGQ